jgi:hypothetical protein
MRTLTSTCWPDPRPTVGQRILLHGAPNSLRSFVKRFISATQAELFEVRRPSRGFARHVRRQKARRP